MTPYHKDDWLTVWQGDCREVMAQMPAESVHTVVTSPPYWGLRDYGTATWLGGDEGCDHSAVRRPGPDDKSFTNGGTSRDKPTNVCRKCGAIRQDSQLGLEPTPEDYVANMVAVFREVKRVLRHDGTCWINIGDSYASSAVSVQRVRPDDGRARTGEGDVRTLLSPDGATSVDRIEPGPGTGEGGGLPSGEQGTPERTDHGAPAGLPGRGDGEAGLAVSVLRGDDPGFPDPRSRPERRSQGSEAGAASALQEGVGRGVSAGAVSDPLLELQRGEGAGGMPTFGSLKQKDLVGIPWRLAFALQADGWYLRSDIIWSKPNPMPESVTDRPTKAHEYLFLLSKSPRYYYDADAVREEVSGGTHSHGRLEARLTQPKANAGGPLMGGKGNGSFQAAMGDLDPALGRNLRSVWSIATQPYPGAHFATFPEKLVEPCVRAGTSERGVCPECGAPWRRETSVEYRSSTYGDSLTPDLPDSNDRKMARDQMGTKAFPERMRKTVETLGWQPSCAHDATPVPAVVLDPFAGSGTTGRVAQRLGRRAVLIDLSGEYLVQAMNRNTEIPLGLETA